VGELIGSDLLLIKSKLYNLEHGVLTMDKSREFGGTPVVKLGDNFKKVAVSIPEYMRRVFAYHIPELRETIQVYPKHQ